MIRSGDADRIRVLAVLEATTVTGPVKNVLGFARLADQHGVDLRVAVFERAQAPTELARKTRALGLQLTRIHEGGPIDPRVLVRLRELVRRVKPHIVETHAVKAHFLIYLSGLWRTVPWVAFHHGYTATDRKMTLYNQLDRASLRLAAHVVTVSRAYQQQLDGRAAPQRITVVPNAVDPCWANRVRSLDRSQARARLGVEGSEPLILCIGRLSHEKGHAYLLSAFDRLRADHPGARLILVGDGPNRSDLERRAPPGVEFAGQTSDVAPYYAAADLVVVPSLIEGSPNVLLESLAAGVPVVATRVGGIPEMVEDGVSARLVPARDPVSIGRAMLEMLSNEGLRRRIAVNGRDLAARRYHPAGRAKSLAAIYHRVAGGTSTA